MANGTTASPPQSPPASMINDDASTSTPHKPIPPEQTLEDGGGGGGDGGGGAGGGGGSEGLTTASAGGREGAEPDMFVFCGQDGGNDAVVFPGDWEVAQALASGAGHDASAEAWLAAPAFEEAAVAGFGAEVLAVRGADLL